MAALLSTCALLSAVGEQHYIFFTQAQLCRYPTVDYPESLQPLCCVLFGSPLRIWQLWRNVWGLETPPGLEESTKDKGEGWLDRLVVGESRNIPKEKKARVRTAVDGMVDKVGHMG